MNAEQRRTLVKAIEQHKLRAARYAELAEQAEQAAREHRRAQAEAEASAAVLQDGLPR